LIFRRAWLDDARMTTRVEVDIRDSREGALLPVRAQPGARRNAITGVHAGQLKVSVAAPPDKGRANAAVIRVLADSLGVKRAEIALATGAASREKVFAISGISAGELRQRVETALRESVRSGSP
jgi:uncharacterized protein